MHVLDSKPVLATKTRQTEEATHTQGMVAVRDATTHTAQKGVVIAVTGGRTDELDRSERIGP